MCTIATARQCRFIPSISITVGSGGFCRKRGLKRWWAINHAGLVVDEKAWQVMRCPGFFLEESKAEIGLVLVTPNMLGILHVNPTLADVGRAAFAAGLELCPPEVGPALCEQWTTMPADTTVRMGMQPIANHIIRPVIFSLWRSKKRYLIPVDGSENAQVKPDSPIVFRCARPEYLH